MELAESLRGTEKAGGRNWVALIYSSLIGKKYVMALTGFVAVGYVVAHVLGNLQVFAGPEKLNAYAAFLKSNLVLLWVVRAFLLTVVLVHIVTGYQLAWHSWGARPVRNRFWRPLRSTIASRTMRWTGPLIALFIIFHILHLTTGTLHPDFREGDVYTNVISGFQRWYVSLVYIVAMIILGVHMVHGVWSMFESVGINHPQYNRLVRSLATVVTVAVSLGFISIPVVVFAGAIT